MKPNLLGRNASMILGLMVASVPGFSKTPVNHLIFTVSLYDYVNLAAGARSELAANADRILRHAGIAAEFVECYTGGAETSDPGCTGPHGPADLTVRIAQLKAAMNGHQLGYAAMTPEGGDYVTVFINPAQQKARVGNLSNGAFLGHAVAHEIGHLLLGANSHSSAGVMRAVWRPVDEEWMVKGALLFDAVQARQMQVALMARLSR